MFPKRKYEILQTKLDTTYGLRIDEDGVFYYSKNLVKSFETYFSFNEIAEKKKVHYEKGYPNLALWSVIIPLLLIAIYLKSGDRGLDWLDAIIWIVIIFTYIYLVDIFTLVKNVCIPISEGNRVKYLYFFENIPSKTTGYEIVESIYKARANNYRERYFRIVESNGKEMELGRMEWLLTEQIISKSEYALIVDLIEETFNLED